MALSWAPKITGDTPCSELLEGSEDIFRDAIADLVAKATKKAAKKVPKEPLVALQEACGSQGAQQGAKEKGPTEPKLPDLGDFTDCLLYTSPSPRDS